MSITERFTGTAFRISTLTLRLYDFFSGYTRVSCEALAGGVGCGSYEHGSRAGHSGHCHDPDLDTDTLLAW